MHAPAPVVLMLALLAVLLLSQQQPAAAASRRLQEYRYTGPRLCPREGGPASSTWMNATRTCLKLHARGAPIQAPADTNTSKWGQIFLDNMGSQPVFIDREGQTYPIDPSIAPADDGLSLMRIWILIIVKAELDNGTVVRFTPRLNVPYSTVMATMADTQFEGTLTNFAPVPAGPNVSSWFKWTFSSNITVADPASKYGTLLQGTFVNLFRSAMAANGTCMPALCSDPTHTSDACQYYTEVFGNSSNAITLNWDANMHAPGDTELVPMFPATSRQYMTRFFNLYEMLLPSTVFVPRNYTFVGHGTPMSTPFDFTGTLVKAKPTVYC